MNLTKWFTMLIVMLALTGFVMAEANDTETNESQEQTFNETQGQALVVRYDHLQCKVTFTNKQIDLFEEYVSVDQTANKDKLTADMTALKALLDKSDKEGFNSYVTETIRPDLQKATQDLNDAKKNFRQYNLSNETKATFTAELKEAKEDYSECVSDKELKIAKVMEKHMENWNKQLEHINKKMIQKNVTTEDMVEIMDEIDARNAKLRELIEAGNITTLREFMKEYQASQFHYAARFEIARLEGYKNKLGPLAEKYNMSGKLHDIDEKIADAEKHAQEGRKYNEGERKQVWDDIKSAGKDMKDTAKGINEERMKERQEKMNERENKIQERQRENKSGQLEDTEDNDEDN